MRKLCGTILAAVSMFAAHAGTFEAMVPMPDGVVSFVLPPLESRLDVRGRMRASLIVKSDCEDTCVYARVSVKKSDGVACRAQSANPKPRIIRSTQRHRHWRFHA